MPTPRAACLVPVLAVILAAAPARGEESVRAEAPASAEPLERGEPVGPPLDPTQMARFFDEYLARRMAEDHVAGAVVYVVKDGQVLFRKGYGLADVERGVPVDPDRTVFPLGSASKLFTWTAVMQLVEQGKLDLGADVRRYLDFDIPATFPAPITLDHLMAHTAGFEDRRFEQMATAPERVVPLGPWLRQHLPARVRPPGELTAYQNYGAALAGYVVERASGMSYDEYVERHVLRPLGMAHTSARARPPAALAAAATRQYRWAGGALRPAPEYEVFPNVGPAASFRSTGGDMARFLVAHLGEGHLGDAVLLRPETEALLQRRSFGHDPRLGGMAHGLWELDANGERILGHAGSHFTANSLVLLFPKRRLGVFVATNSAGGSAFLGEGFDRFVQDFADRFFPAAPAREARASLAFAARAGRFAGSYGLVLGRAETTAEKLLSLPMAVRVRADGDALAIELPGGTARFVEAGPLLFRQVDGPAVVAFRQGAGGEITHAFLGAIPLTALVRQRWFETPAFLLSLLVACALAFASALLAAPLAAWRRRRVPAPPPRGLERLGRAATLALSAAGLATLAALVAFLGDAFARRGYPIYVGQVRCWGAVRGLALGTVFLAAMAVPLAGAGWTQRGAGLAGRVHRTLVALAGVGLGWFLWAWNVLGKGF